LVGWALRPCNKSRRAKLDRMLAWDIIVRMGFMPFKRRNGDKLNRKGRVGNYW
jgi:hypothetical protein